MTKVGRPPVHGKSGTREYKRWKLMRARCYSTTNKDYPNYGGRGIKVCDRWKNSFGNFLEDMGECPDNFTLERRDPNKDYCPENCLWIHYSKQARNKRKHPDNTTGYTGVHLRDNDSYRGAVASWHSLDGKKHQKCFAFSKFGYEGAIEAARSYRENQIKLLNLEGAGYGEQHGR